MTKIYWFALVLISIAFIINPQSLPASTTADVKYDGKRISVHANGVSLKQLLSMVQKQTGVQFSYDALLAETNVYAIFKNNSLADGLRRILLQFNYAVIYTGSGHIKTVLVLNRQQASSNNSGDQTELYASLRPTNINDVSVISPDPEEAPPNDMSGNTLDPEEETPFSEQTPEQRTSGQDIPPVGEQPVLDKNAIPPPPGEKALAPVVDPDVSSPPGAEPLSPVVDQNTSPPPGEDSLASDNVSTLSSDTEKKAAPHTN